MRTLFFKQLKVHIYSEGMEAIRASYTRPNAVVIC
jgi:hypothetical protein